MSENVKVVQSGTPVVGLLGVCFVVLKLCGVIDWSWWWVTAPFWGGLAVAFAFVALLAISAGAVLGCAAIADAVIAWRRKRAK